jgi:uncharacterized protein YodC (DUF2158 family)
MSEQSEQSVNLGDIVKLKSGGPSMTVRRLVGSKIEVDWFYQGEAQSAVFEGYQLKRIESLCGGPPL